MEDQNFPTKLNKRGILIGYLEDPNFAKRTAHDFVSAPRFSMQNIIFSGQFEFQNDVTLIKNLVKCLTLEQIQGML